MIHIACAADKNYAPHCAAMLHSVFTNNPPGKVTIHFLHGPGMEAGVLGQLKQVVLQVGGEIRFHEIPDHAVTGLQSKGRVAGVMWYRVFLPERLTELDRILYLDADTLVVDSLQPLWESELDGYYGAAVTNIFDPEYRHRPAFLGLHGESEYFNSGVLLMNLDAMRRNSVAQRVCEVAREHGDKLMWQDQDPLNMVFSGKWLRLHPRWNCQNSFFYSNHAVRIFGKGAVEEACRNPGIVHFEGPALAKPWHYLSKHPYKSDYLKHRAQTPWAVVEEEGKTTKNRILKPFPTRVAVAFLKGEHWVKQRITKFSKRSAL